jgi:hypothetical protein
MSVGIDALNSVRWSFDLLLQGIYRLPAAERTPRDLKHQKSFTAAHHFRIYA